MFPFWIILLAEISPIQFMTAIKYNSNIELIFLFRTFHQEFDIISDSFSAAIKLSNLSIYALDNCHIWISPSNWCEMWLRNNDPKRNPNTAKSLRKSLTPSGRWWKYPAHRISATFHQIICVSGRLILWEECFTNLF